MDTNAAVPCLFTIRNLRKTFREANGAPRVALDIDRLNIYRNKITAVIGPSGSGKSTLINILGGLEDPDNGTTINLSLDGQPPKPLVTSSVYLSRHASYAFQHDHLLLNGGVALNLRIVSNDYENPEARHMALSYAGLDDLIAPDEEKFLAKRAWMLSGGERQRLNVSRALLRDPKVFFADEPSGNLDPELSNRVISSLCEWVRAKTHRSLVLVTHDYELASFADNLVILLDGTVVYADDCPHTREEIKTLLHKVKAEEEQRKNRGRGSPQPEAGTVTEIEEMRSMEPAETEYQTKKGKRRARAFRHSGTLALEELFGPSTAPGFVPFLSRFKRWPSFFVFTLIIILLSVALLTEKFSNSYFEKSIRDPRLRNVIIAGNPLHQKETHLTPELVTSLEDPEKGSYAVPNKGVFPRTNGSFEEMLVVNPETEERLWRENLQLLRMSSSEPVAEDTPLLTVEGEKTGRSLAEAMKDLDRKPGEVAIALDRKYFERMATRAGITNTGVKGVFQLRGHSGSGRDVILLGLYEDSIPDRYHVFQGIMSMTSYVNWLSEQDPGRLMNGEPRSYQRLAIYFDEHIYESTFRALDKTLFEFNRDNFKKLTKLLIVSKKFKINLTTLVLGVCLIACIYVVLVAAELLRSVKRSALILCAHAVSPWVFIVSIWLQLLIILSMAYVFAYVIISIFSARIGMAYFFTTVLAATKYIGVALVLAYVVVLCIVFKSSRNRSGIAQKLKGE